LEKIKKKRSEQRQMETLEDGGHIFGMLLRRRFRRTVGRAGEWSQKAAMGREGYLVGCLFWCFVK
jgi:hypothetical protein